MMRAVDVLRNLEGFLESGAVDYTGYKMCKDEILVCIEALKIAMNLDQFIECEGADNE